MLLCFRATRLLVIVWGGNIVWILVGIWHPLIDRALTLAVPLSARCWRKVGQKHGSKQAEAHLHGLHGQHWAHGWHAWHHLHELRHGLCYLMRTCFPWLTSGPQMLRSDLTPAKLQRTAVANLPAFPSSWWSTFVQPQPFLQNPYFTFKLTAPPTTKVGGWKLNN